MRRAMRSRFWSSVSGMKLPVVSQKRRSKDRSLQLPHRPSLDALLVFRALENGVDKNAGCMHFIGIELAKLDEFFDFGDDVIGGRCHHRIEVARGLAIDEIAPAVAFPRL